MSNPFVLLDQSGQQVPDLFPVPGYNSTQSVIIREFCVLPPAELATRGLSGSTSAFHSCGGTRFHFGTFFDECIESQSKFNRHCVWNRLKSKAIELLDESMSNMCLPLDDPILVSRGVYPTIKMEDEKARMIDIEYVHAPILKHYLQSRNLTVPRLVNDANVLPMHKTMRLGICVPVPPTGSPCALDALTDKNTLSPAWSVAARERQMYPDAALAWPKAELAKLVGPRLDAFDHLTFSNGQALPPLPVIHAYSSEKGMSWSWAQPLVACIAANGSSSRIGTVQKLKMDGLPCASSRECFSGQCISNVCRDTAWPGALSFDLDRPVAHPADFGPYLAFLTGRLTRPPSYYFLTTYVLAGVLGGMLALTFLWTSCARKVVRTAGIKMGLVRKTVEEREMELKPVSGAIVGDSSEVAAEAVVRQEADALPRYESGEQLQEGGAVSGRRMV